MSTLHVQAQVTASVPREYPVQYAFAFGDLCQHDCWACKEKKLAAAILWKRESGIVALCVPCYEKLRYKTR